jgi:ribosomal protein L11 methyltransferase
MSNTEQSTDGSWVEIQVEVPSPIAELLAAELADLAGGVELRDAETIFPTARDRTTVVALCRPEERDDLLGTVDDVLATARAAGDTVDPVGIRQRPAHEDEWRDVWKQFFRTTRIGERFAVRPSWDPGGIAGVEHIIELDPGRAFGTGAHPSTRLVIGALERLAAGGAAISRFLDLGCGSGILTIAAHRLWPAARGWAVDLDPEAADCTRENLARNGVQEDIEVAAATLAELGPDARGFDLVMANIQRDVLETLVTGLHAALVPGGWLVLSGLLTGDAEPVRAAYVGAGLQLVARTDEGEWASLLLRR